MNHALLDQAHREFWGKLIHDLKPEFWFTFNYVRPAKSSCWCSSRCSAWMTSRWRWRHPERGLLLAEQFIAVCEESGLIVELGRRVLHEAARHHALLAAAGLAHLRIAVNVSAAQFAQDPHADIAEVTTRSHCRTPCWISS